MDIALGALHDLQGRTWLVEGCSSVPQLWPCHGNADAATMLQTPGAATDRRQQYRAFTACNLMVVHAVTPFTARLLTCSLCTGHGPDLDVGDY